MSILPQLTVGNGIVEVLTGLRTGTEIKINKCEEGFIRGGSRQKVRRGPRGGRSRNEPDRREAGCDLSKADAAPRCRDQLGGPGTQPALPLLLSG